MSIEEYVFFGAAEKGLDLFSAVYGRYDEIRGTLGYFPSLEIGEENLLQCLQIREISADDVKFTIGREARITQISRRYDIGIVDDEEFGMDEIIELGTIVGDGYSGALQRLERFAVYAGGAKYILLEHDPNVDSSFFRVFQSLDDPLLRENIYLYENLFLRSIYHG